MAYHLDILDREQLFLDGLPLSPKARRGLDDFLEYAIRRVTDAYRLDPANRPGPRPTVFVVPFILRDGTSYFALDFHVSDSSAPSGVLRLLFVDQVHP